MRLGFDAVDAILANIFVHATGVGRLLGNPKSMRIARIALI